MKLAKFTKLAETYGSQIKNWPEHYHLDAYALRETLPHETQAVLDKAAILDNLLDQNELAFTVSPDKMTQIAATAMAQPQQALVKTNWRDYLSTLLGFEFRPAYLFAPGGSLAALVVIGFFIGFTGHMPGDTLLLDPAFYNGMEDADLLLEIINDKGML